MYKNNNSFYFNFVIVLCAFLSAFANLESHIKQGRLLIILVFYIFFTRGQINNPLFRWKGEVKAHRVASDSHCPVNPTRSKTKRNRLKLSARFLKSVARTYWQQ